MAEAVLRGRPDQVFEKAVKLVTIGTNARWEDGTFKVKYKDLTQVSFGGDYEKALWVAAGGPASEPAGREGALNGP